jgi:hypothetical protein
VPRVLAVADEVRLARCPKLLGHGHIHPYGKQVPDRRIGETLVVDTVGFRVLNIEEGGDG